MVGRPFAAVDLSLIVSALNDFFTIHPVAEKDNAAQFQAATTFLESLVLHVGTQQLVKIAEAAIHSAQTSALMYKLQGGAAGGYEAQDARSRAMRGSQDEPETF